MFEIGAGFSVDRLAPIHNFRKGELPGNVDPERVKDNVILVDNLKGRTIDQFTNQEMQEVIDRYNQKQKRKDRRVEVPYTEWHKSNYKFTQNAKTLDDVHLAYEAVLSFGGMDDIGKWYREAKTEEERQKIHEMITDIYAKWIKDFQEKYKHLRIIYAVIHFDEKTPHCHLAYQARATDYKRGFDTQVCISKALQQDGVEKIQNATLAKEMGGFQQARFYKMFREEIMEPDLERLGFKIKPTNDGKKREHIPSNEYTELMQIAERKMQEANERIEISLSLEKEMKELEEIQERTPVYSKDEIKHVQVKTGGMFSKETEEVIQMPVDTWKSASISIDAKNLNKKTEEKIRKAEQTMEKYMDMMMNDKEKELTQKVDELEKSLADANRIIGQKERELQQKDRMIRRLENFVDKVHEIIKRYAPQIERMIWRDYEEIERTR